MTDVEFCTEFVKRIPVPYKRKSEVELKNIVIEKIRLDPQCMFDDHACGVLFKCSVEMFVYKFVRDNVDLFLQ